MPGKKRTLRNYGSFLDLSGAQQNIVHNHNYAYGHKHPAGAYDNPASAPHMEIHAECRAEKKGTKASCSHNGEKSVAGEEKANSEPVEVKDEPTEESLTKKAPKHTKKVLTITKYRGTKMARFGEGWTDEEDGMLCLLRVQGHDWDTIAEVIHRERRDVKQHYKNLKSLTKDAEKYTVEYIADWYLKALEKDLVFKGIEVCITKTQVDRTEKKTPPRILVDIVEVDRPEEKHVGKDKSSKGKGKGKGKSVAFESDSDSDSDNNAKAKSNRKGKRVVIAVSDSDSDPDATPKARKVNTKVRPKPVQIEDEDEDEDNNKRRAHARHIHNRRNRRGSDSSGSTSTMVPESSSTETSTTSDLTKELIEQLEEAYPNRARLTPDLLWSAQDCRALAAIEAKYEANKWLYIQAEFANLMGRMVDVDLIEHKFGEVGVPAGPQQAPGFVHWGRAWQKK